MRYIAQVDYGPGENAKRPRWFVFEQYFIWAGNHGTRRFAGPFWTASEASRELDVLNQTPDWVWVVLGGLVALVGYLILKGYLL